jgi:hypothetical protein
MKKVITLAVTLLALAASSAQAQSGLNLAWSECITGAGAQDLGFACNTNTGAAFTMHASVVVPAAMPMFAATSTVLDIHVGDVSLPAWWQTLAGQCRQNAIGISYDVNNNVTSCVDLWQGNPNLQVSTVQQDVNGPGRVRVLGTAAVPAGSELSVPQDDAELWVCRITISRSGTLGTCNTGCALGACIVLNEMYMQQPGGLPAYRLTNEATRQFVTWNGGGGTNCPTDTPTMNRTWGAVKGLYR